MSQDLKETLEFWQARTKRKLTIEDARQIQENMTGFFKIQLEWEAKEKKQAE